MNYKINSPISISLNFDSLNEAYGFPKKFVDPTFFEVFNRIETLANKYNFPLTIFIIGKDLEKKKNCDQIKRWHDQGHEIANHTYMHLFNFGKLNKSLIKSEIYRCHEKIFNIIKVEPKGFIAPGWNNSLESINALIDLKYDYDTSSFPSIFLYPMITKIFINHIFNNFKKGIKILNRGDFFDPFLKSTQPHFVYKKLSNKKNLNSERILELPIPTINRFTVPIWHTIGFIFGKKFLIEQVLKLLNSHECFYYVMHPADFLDSKDLKGTTNSLARIKIQTQYKLELIDSIFKTFLNSGRKVVTMKKLADYHKKRLLIK
jgi:hypothetical protein